MNRKHLSQALSHFHALSYQDQLNSVWQQGKLLEARRIPGFWLHLYAVNTFFVEMWICQRRYEVTLLRGFLNTEDLEPYLDKISLNGILQDL
ncbi:hypothetical protein [Larkinella humicola]|uniref:Uncharacterized protein n=1 Tax=Larkinella humicola TaxID=2607654 RepID=A0A5N1JG36_9BACT|nr:hypothetical protein [Larkinella humicola]KAA9349600.1 hypothetical protein F0P93_19240 [Larkinella humicola]